MAMCIPLHRQLTELRRQLRGRSQLNDQERISAPAQLLDVLRRTIDECAVNDIDLSMRSDGRVIDDSWRDAAADLFLQCGVAMRNTVKAMEICLRVRKPVFSRLCFSVFALLTPRSVYVCIRPQAFV